MKAVRAIMKASIMSPARLRSGPSGVVVAVEPKGVVYDDHHINLLSKQ